MTLKEISLLPPEKAAPLFVHAVESVENLKYYSSILPEEESKKLNGSYKAAIEAVKFELFKDVAVGNLFLSAVAELKREGLFKEGELCELSEEQAAKAARSLTRDEIEKMSGDFDSSYNDSCYYWDKEHDEIYFGVLQGIYCRIKKLAIEE